MNYELLTDIMVRSLSRKASCKRQFEGDAKGFTFRTKDGKYPVAGKGQSIQFVSNQAECLELAEIVGATTLVVISKDNKILDEIEIDYET